MSLLTGPRDPPLGLWELIEARARATPNALFAIDEAGLVLSFEEYRDAALVVAAGFAARGVTTNSAVSWLLPTWIEALVLSAALARLGARQNPILPIYRGREVGFICRQSRAELLVVPTSFRGFDYAAMARSVAEEIDGLDVITVDGGRGALADALPAADPSELGPAPAPPRPEAAPVRWLFYTSGTTADPKGALHTDLSLYAASAGMADVLSLSEDDRIALVFPVTHIGGIGWLMAGLDAGACQLVVPTFDPSSSIPFLAEHGVTQGTAGTAFHQAYLAAQRELEARRPGAKLFPEIRAFPGGGAPKPPQLHRDVRAELGGVGIVSGYGMTECPIIAMNRTTDPDAKLAHTEGRANPALEMQIRIVRAGRVATAAGEEGELFVRGPQLFRGYLDEALDAAAFDDEGFLRTGDLGYLDPEGFVVITGRLKDVIIRKGENISAREIEDLLHTHPSVSEAAVVGLPDSSTGERACAVVVCRAGAPPLSFDAMVAFLKNKELMIQKIPEQLECVDALPRNPTGKVLKQTLKARYAVLVGAEGACER